MAKQSKATEQKGSTAKKRANAAVQARGKKGNNPNKNKNQRQGFFTRTKEYFKGVRLEMKKVVWPTKKELGSYTVVVLSICIAFALAFWAVDSAVLAAIRAICF